MFWMRGPDQKPKWNKNFIKSTNIAILQIVTVVTSEVTSAGQCLCISSSICCCLLFVLLLIFAPVAAYCRPGTPTKSTHFCPSCAANIGEGRSNYSSHLGIVISFLLIFLVVVIFLIYFFYNILLTH